MMSDEEEDYIRVQWQSVSKPHFFIVDMGRGMLLGYEEACKAGAHIGRIFNPDENVVQPPILLDALLWHCSLERVPGGVEEEKRIILLADAATWMNSWTEYEEWQQSCRRKADFP